MCDRGRHPKKKNSIFTYHNSANNITKHLFWKQPDHAKQNVHKNFDISTSMHGVISTLLGADFDKRKMIQNFKHLFHESIWHVFNAI